MGRDNSVGIATCYELDGAGIESRWGREFTHQPRPALGPSQLPIQFVPGLFRGGKAASASRCQPAQSSTQVKERLELYLHCPSVPSWSLLGRTLPLPLPLHSVRYKKQPKEQTPVNTGICTAVKGCPSVAVDTHNIC